VPLSIEHGAHGVGESRADRRVLVHPREPGRFAQALACGGTKPDPGRRADLDRAESARVRPDWAGAGVAQAPVAACALRGAAARPARAVADVGAAGPAR